MQNLALKTFGYLLCIPIHDLRDWVHYSYMLLCTKYFKAISTLLSDNFCSLIIYYYLIFALLLSTTIFALYISIMYMYMYTRKRVYTVYTYNLFFCWKNLDIYLFHVMTAKKFMTVLRHQVPLVRGYKNLLPSVILHLIIKKFKKL